MNGNVELGRELIQLTGKIPTMASKVKDLDHIDSITNQLEEMKTFGQRLEQ